jgi:methylmalonyl-CoA/ethylmalonyl-CoA epimerase
MELSKIGQIALTVTSADRAQAFYRDTLGIRELFRFGDLVFFDCDGVRLMLEGSKKEKLDKTGGPIYFRVTGIEAMFAQLRAGGVVFVDTPHKVARMPDHELWMCFFNDPDGNLLALMEEKR